MHQIDQDLQRCIHQCLGCYQMCFSEAMTHCLDMGGDHTAPDHFRLMIECAELCRMAAHFMLMNSERHVAICAECAEACEACADSCERLDGMDICVESCRKCAASCRAMAESRIHAA